MKILFLVTLFLFTVNTCFAQIDFQSRCNSPGVTVCEGFDYTTQADYDANIAPFARGQQGLIDNSVKASGSGSLHFTIKSNLDHAHEGAYRRRFSKVPGLGHSDQQHNDPANQFGPGDEFFIQWRQRFDNNFLNDPDIHFGGGGQKMIMVDSGDLPGCQNYPSEDSSLCAASCTIKEIVVQNSWHRGLPHVYHSCGGKDGQYEPIQYFDSTLGNVVVQNEVGCLYPEFASPPCKKLLPDQWMTFQLHVKIGTLYENDSNYKHDSTIRLYVANEGEAPVLVLDHSPQGNPDACHEANPNRSIPGCKTGYDLVNMAESSRGQNWNGSGFYGRVFLIPLDFGKDAVSNDVTAHVWYDELIIGTQFIPFPVGTVPDSSKPNAPANLRQK